jgi:hypothetical protein
MRLQQLNEEDLRETFQRAREIADYSEPLPGGESELETYIRAAEEVGIPREATLQALRERFALHGEAFEVGQQVFAPSVDGFWYIATIQKLADHTATVQFGNGGTHTCAVSDLRHLSFLPGRKLQGDVKGWGWYNVRVNRYDADKQKLHVIHDDWSETKEAMQLHQLRLTKDQACPPTRTELDERATLKKALVRCAWLAGGTGLALGFLLDRLLPVLLGFLR